MGLLAIRTLTCSEFWLGIFGLRPLYSFSSQIPTCCLCLRLKLSFRFAATSFLSNRNAYINFAWIPSAKTLSMSISHEFSRPTARVSCGGWEGRLAVETETTQSQKTAQKTRRVPTVSCTLCWALVHSVRLADVKKPALPTR